jgi:phosphopantothenoylcysteine decarboxylase/phosphopantothenate--cysteine ligase
MTAALKGKTVVLGVTGSIAVYKAADLASKLVQAGARVDVVLTPSAAEFVTPLTFRGLTQGTVIVDMFAAAEEHIEVARRADVVVVAPATGTTIARLAHGLAEDMVSLTVLATRAPVLVCPAMDAQMFANVATQANLETLRGRGMTIVGPEEGRLATGRMGLGRLSDTETILGAIRYVLGREGDLAGCKVVVTAGGTREPIDPVRYVGNYSSGKMGYAVAEAARDRGAEVVLVSAPTALPTPFGVRLVPVGRAAEMRDAVVRECRGAQVLVMAAAVADYQPAATAIQKIKRRAPTLTLELERTPDILAEAGQGFLKVGFAAESEDLLANARRKLETKGLELIVANDVTAADSGFGSDTNRVVILDRHGGEERLPLLSKYEVAQRLWDRIVPLLAKRRRRR